MNARIIQVVAVSTLLLSAVSWTYRFIDDYLRTSEIVFYILVPLVAWLLFVGPVLLLHNERRFVRIVAFILLVPTGLLWAISVHVGFFGLRIH